MRRKDFKYIYGPVSSWRLGCSLGIDLLSRPEKVCPFDCIYCQLGKSKNYATQRKLYVPSKEIIREIKALPKLKIDYLTFSGRGEPTLAKNLGALIRAVKKVRPEPIAVLTNASLLERKEVRKALLAADLVAIKLDADSEKSFRLINRPAKTIKFSAILHGIKQLRQEYRGKLTLQIMLMPENRSLAPNIARLARELHADEIQLNTPKRLSPVKPLSAKAIAKIKRHFRGMTTISLYERKRKKVKPLSAKATVRRRGTVAKRGQSYFSGCKLQAASCRL